MEKLTARDRVTGEVRASLDVPMFSVLVTVQVPVGKVVEPQLVKIGEAALEAVLPNPRPQSIVRRLERQAVSPNLDLVIVRFHPANAAGGETGVVTLPGPDDPAGEG